MVLLQWKCEKQGGSESIESNINVLATVVRELKLR